MNINKNKIKTKALTTKQEGQNVCWNADKMNQLPAAKKNYNFVIALIASRLWWVSSKPFGLPFCLPVQF